MSIFIIIFLIIFYLNLRFLIVISWYTPPSEKQRPSVTTQWLWLLPLLSLLVLGFLIMGIIFFPLIILFLFDPVKLVSPKLYYTRVKQWSVKVVANNFHSALWYYIISTVFLWINYYYNFF